MAQFCTIPLCNPFKMIRDTDAQGLHFDEAWAASQVRAFQLRAHYTQKWAKGDKTHLYLESTIAPQPLKIIDLDGVTKKTIAWSAVFSATTYAGYKLDFDISDLPDGKYFLTLQVTLSGIDWRWISEPIYSRSAWPGTRLFRYKNSFNTQGVAFTAGISFAFRCECDIPPSEMTPKRERTTSVSQTRNVRTRYAVAYRTFQLHVGQSADGSHAAGVAPWVVDLLNRIFCMDTVSIEGKRYESNTDADWEVVAHKGYPLVGATLELVEAFNNDAVSAGLSEDGTPLDSGSGGSGGTGGTTVLPGVVVAYDIETGFFGTSNNVPITEIDEQG